MDNIISGINVSGQVYTILDPNAIHESEFSAYSGAVDTSLSSKASQTTVDALNDVVTAHTADTSIHLTSGDIETIISSQTADFVTGEELSSYTYDKATIDSKIASGGTFDPTQYYNKTATDELLNKKLDASAYTPTDLSNYYNKQEVDGIVASAKTEIEGEIPSLSGYATEQWVEDKHYITGVDLSNYALNSELIQYITNLQEQINSLASSISGCCGETGETQYRWITMTGANDYWCSGTTKYSKEKKQSSTDGITWTDVIPEETRNGSTILEVNCIDCGYQPVTSGNADVAIIFSTNDQAPYQLATDTSNVTTTHICVYTGSGSSSSVCKDYESGFTQITDAVLKDVYQYSTALGFGAEVFKNTSVISNNEFSGNAANSVTLVSGITEIGNYAFANSTVAEIGRPQMTPSSLSEWWLDLASIGNYAFANNPNLTTVYLYGLNNVPTLGTGAFDNCPNLAHIYVDADKVNSFKTSSGWSNYASIIQAA